MTSKTSRSLPWGHRDSSRKKKKRLENRFKNTNNCLNKLQKKVTENVVGRKLSRKKNK